MVTVVCKGHTKSRNELLVEENLIHFVIIASTRHVRPKKRAPKCRKPYLHGEPDLQKAYCQWDRATTCRKFNSHGEQVCKRYITRKKKLWCAGNLIHMLWERHNVNNIELSCAGNLTYMVCKRHTKSGNELWCAGHIIYVVIIVFNWKACHEQESVPKCRNSKLHGPRGLQRE